MMTIDDLIAALEEARDDLGGDTEVLIATQRHYPLTHEVVAISTLGDDDPEADGSRTAAALWLATEQPGRSGDLNPYAPEAAWDGDYWSGPIGGDQR